MKLDSLGVGVVVVVVDGGDVGVAVDVSNGLPGVVVAGVVSMAEDGRGMEAWAASFRSVVVVVVVVVAVVVLVVKLVWCFLFPFYFVFMKRKSCGI